MAHISRLRNELLSRRERTQLAEMQLAQDEMRSFKGWPMCGSCMRPVRAYGKGDETKREVVVWARCRHMGRDVYEEKRIRKPSESITEQAGHWFSNQVRMAVFFAPRLR